MTSSDPTPAKHINMWQTHPTKGPHSGVQPDKRADTLTKGDDNRTHAIAVDVHSLNGHLECLLFRIDRCFSLGRTLLMCWLCLHSQEAVINAEEYMFELRTLKAYDSL